MTWAHERLNEIQSGAVDAPPVVRTLKLGLLDEWGPGWAKKIWLPSPEILNGDGSMFGGYLAALADQILAFAAMTVIDNDRAFRTTNLSMHFFKLTGATPLVITGRVTNTTRQIISVEAEIERQNGALVARAIAQQITVELARGPLKSDDGRER